MLTTKALLTVQTFRGVYRMTWTFAVHILKQISSSQSSNQIHNLTRCTFHFSISWSWNNCSTFFIPWASLNKHLYPNQYQTFKAAIQKWEWGRQPRGLRQYSIKMVTRRSLVHILTFPLESVGPVQTQYSICGHERVCNEVPWTGL